MKPKFEFVNGSLWEEKKEIPVARNCDVAIAGGGPSGLAAAIASARTGADTLLVESQSFLGGVATSTMMAALVDAKRANGISEELIKRMGERNGAPLLSPEKNVNTIPFDPETFKTCALQMLMESGASVLFYTIVTEPIVVGDEIRGFIIENKNGRQAILARQVIDCTGDADLAYRAGAPCVKGREEDGKMRPLSLLARMGGVDVYKTLKYLEENPEEIQPQYRNGGILKAGEEDVVQRLSGFYKLVEQAKEEGGLFPECHYFRLENLWASRGTVICNTARAYFLDGTDADDLTKAEIICRRQIDKLLEFARKYVPGFENAFVIDISSRLGVRETRRIKGVYTLTDEDAYGDATFEDPILFLSGNLVKRPLPKDLDVHMPEPIEGSDKDWLEKYPERVPMAHHEYQLPFRCLIPQNIRNLLVAGRSLSVSHMIDSFTRNMIPCMWFGQAAGAAAGLCIKYDTIPAELEYEKLHQELKRQGLTF